MSAWKKLLATSAAAGGGLNIENVFSTYLYTGNGSTQTITNGIDLSGEGGLVWGKTRSVGYDHFLFDTERGINKMLVSNLTQAEEDRGSGGGVTSFNSDGFTLGNTGQENDSGEDYTSWTFRKAPKFFDVVTYTGTGSAQNISHNLGTTVGCLIIKRTDTTQPWYVYHRGVTFGATQYPLLSLNSTAAAQVNKELLNSTEPTDTVFSVASDLSISGGTYVAYLFAHNDGDGEFGSTADQDIIKCGSYTGNGSTTGPEIDLGFEPQWIMIKRTDSTGGWRMLDVMRGITDSGSQELSAQDTAVESGAGNHRVYANGYQPLLTGAAYNASGGTYIYIAIRRGPMAVPTAATDVFAIDTENSTGDGNLPQYRSGFPVDMALEFERDGGLSTRPLTTGRLIQGKYLVTSSTAAEGSWGNTQFDFMNGWLQDGDFTADTTRISHMWKRAPSFFDVVAYTGNGVRGRTVSHNLGVVPEMMWIKNRDDAQNWLVYIHSLGGTKKLYLNTTAAAATASIDDFNNTDAEATQFTLGNDGRCNANNQDYIAYLFASLDGVSKVGSFSHTYGSDTTVDCGFSSGARFVIIKRSSDSGDWMVFDTERGIVAGNDARLLLNSTAAEATNADNIDPNSGGFVFTGANGGGTYIFYAIA